LGSLTVLGSGWGPRAQSLIAKAPCVIDGPIDGDRFVAYVEQVFAQLKALTTE
jgi:hypothetical protein